MSVSIQSVSQSVSGPRCILILHHHYPSPYRLIQSFFSRHFSSVYPSTYYTFILFKFYFCHCYCTYYYHTICILSLLLFPCQSRLQPVTARYQLLRHTHSLTVRACDEPAVSHPCLALHCNPTKSGTGYRRAHTLSRSLRDRQLAPAYYTPPPNLLGLATVQIEKSHIPPRQVVTHHHLNASRLAP